MNVNVFALAWRSVSPADEAFHGIVFLDVDLQLGQLEASFFCFINIAKASLEVVDKSTIIAMLT